MAPGPVPHIPLCAGTHGILVNLVQYNTAPYEQHYIVRMNGASHDASYAGMMSGRPKLQDKPSLVPFTQQLLFAGTHPVDERTLADSHIPKRAYAVSQYHETSTHSCIQHKNTAPRYGITATGCCVCNGWRTDLVSHKATLQYLQCWSVSRPGSGWDGVGPLRSLHANGSGRTRRYSENTT